MLYIVPSRGRPHKIVELIESWETTREDAKLCIALDEDDETLPKYTKILEHPRYWLSARIAPRMRMIGTLNHWAKYFAPYHDVIGFMGDDHRPRTQHWDRYVAEAGRTHIVYGNDLLQGPILPTQVAMPGRFIMSLGYMAPPGLIHLYADNFWKQLGERVGITYLHNVVIEHMHPVAGKAEWDEMYKEVNSGTMYETDRATYQHYMDTHFEADVVKVIEGRSKGDERG